MQPLAAEQHDGVSVDDLIEWLRAQLDADERIARATIDHPDDDGTWTNDESGNVSGKTMAIYADDHDQRHGEHITRHDPARVLADVDAKRRMVDECAVTIRQGLSVGLAETMLAMLALPYAGRPGFKDEWRPAE